MAHGSHSGSLVLSSSDRSTCITEQSMPSNNNVSDTSSLIGKALLTDPYKRGMLSSTVYKINIKNKIK